MLGQLREYYIEKILVEKCPKANSTTLAGRQSHLLNVNHWTLSYMIQWSPWAFELRLVPKLGQAYNHGLNLEPLDLELKQMA